MMKEAGKTLLAALGLVGWVVLVWFLACIV
jgi:hypothetical protein